MSEGVVGEKPAVLAKTGVSGEAGGSERAVVFGHFLQSGEWGKYEQAEGRRTLRVEGEGFRAMVVVHETALGKYLFCPYGPELWEVEGHDLKWSLEQALSSLAEVARKEKAIFVRVEPTVGLAELFPGAVGSGGSDEASGASAEVAFEKGMRGLGLVKSHDLDPAHTWVLDLTKGRECLLAGMEKRKVRYWRNYTKKFKMRQTKDPEEIGLLTGLLAKLGERDNFNPQDEGHLRRQLEAGFATMYVLEALPLSEDVEVVGGARNSGVGESAGDAGTREGSEDAGGGDGAGDGSSLAEGDDVTEKKVAAVALVYDYEGVRYYAHAAADEALMKYAPGSIVLIQMILDACEAGEREFDFWGMTTSEDPKHPWYGFTQYKKSFGGRQVDYAGTWDLPVDKVKYRLYQGVRGVNRVMRKRR